MSQNLHQFFQITDMISRLERQFFLPCYGGGGIEGYAQTAFMRVPIV